MTPPLLNDTPTFKMAHPPKNTAMQKQYDEFYTLLQTGFWIVRGLGSLVMKIRLEIDKVQKGLALEFKKLHPSLCQVSNFRRCLTDCCDHQNNSTVV